MDRTGVLLLGGTGRRLGSLTISLNKHLLPLYSRTMAEHACSTLLRMGCQRIVAVTARHDVETWFGVLSPVVGPHRDLKIVEQPNPAGTRDAVEVATTGIGNGEEVVVLFGDNVFLGDLPPSAMRPLRVQARCFAKYVVDELENFGALIEQQAGWRLIGKPHGEPSGYALTGLFLFRTPILERVSPEKSEDDIADVVRAQLDEGVCEVDVVDTAWYDAGFSHEALWKASTAVRAHIRDERGSSS